MTFSSFRLIFFLLSIFMYVFTSKITFVAEKRRYKSHYEITGLVDNLFNLCLNLCSLVVYSLYFLYFRPQLSVIQDT